MLWLRSHFTSTDDIWAQAIFRLHFSFDVLTVPHWRYPVEVQPQDELWIIKSGHCAIQQNKRKDLAKTGDIVILRAGESRLTFDPFGEPIEILGFGFSATLFATNIVEIWSPPLCFPDVSTRVTSLMNDFATENLQRSSLYTLRTQALAQQVFVEALRTYPPPQENWESALARLRAAQEGAVAEALRYIESHYHQPLDLEKLARAVHLSPKHLSRRFKNALGVAPSDYWRSYRLQQARSLLIISDENITCVAKRCGFDDAAYFSRAFKRQFGSSPQDFRATLRQLMRP